MMLRRHQLCVALLWLLCGSLLPAQMVPLPKPEDGTLRPAIERIHCATSSEDAALHLQKLKNNSLFPPGLPSESNPAYLQATTLDTVLLVLSESAKKFPTNKHLIEQTVIQWNFCTIIDNTKLYDHYSVNGQTKRIPSNATNNHSWSGFRAFGLLPATSGSDVFDFTTPYIDTTIRSLADRQLQQSYISHCLPHPDQEHLYRDFGRNFISRVVPPTKDQSPLRDAKWNLQCEIVKPVLTENKSERGNKTDSIAEAQPTIHTSIEPVAAAALGPTPVEVTETLPAEPASLPQIQNPPTQEQAPQSIEIPVSQSEITVSQNNIPSSVAVPIPAIEEDNILEAAPIGIIGRGSSNAVVTTDKKTPIGLSGSISLDNRSFQAENTSLNVSVSYKPVQDSYWFIRSGLNLSQASKPLTYTWGFGYDDWHPGTWAIQLNHWGPLKPGDGLDLKNAVAEISYKFRYSWLTNRNLSSSIALSSPLSSDPSLSWGWSWSPRSNWFIRSTVVKPLGDSGLNWSYGFGNTRYTNKSLSLEYNNWGLNELPEPNFKKNGLVSLIYRWAF